MIIELKIRSGKNEKKKKKKDGQKWRCLRRLTDAVFLLLLSRLFFSLADEPITLRVFTTLWRVFSSSFFLKKRKRRRRCGWWWWWWWWGGIVIALCNVSPISNQALILPSVRRKKEREKKCNYPSSNKSSSSSSTCFTSLNVGTRCSIAVVLVRSVKMRRERRSIHLSLSVQSEKRFIS